LKSYFLRRLLLIPPTLVGITLLVFTITRFVPGGPMDRMLQEAARGADQGGKRSTSSQSRGGLSEEQMEEIEEQYGLDKPILIAYAQWLGVLPKEVRISKGEFTDRGDETIGGGVDSADTTEVVLRGDGRVARVKRTDGAVSAVFAESGKPIASEDWKVRYEPTRTARSASCGATPARRPRRTMRRGR
jgi:microcin C transport system permease protein